MKYEYRKYRIELVRESEAISEYEYTVSGSEDVKNFLVDICRLNRNAQEVCLALAVNTKGRITGYTTISMGDIASSVMHPRELFKYLIACNASAGIICHNHPSEDPTPSEEDIRVTKRMMEAGEIIGIPILDHVIVGNENDYVSLKAFGYID